MTHQDDKREDSRLDAQAKACGVDVVFARTGNGTEGNLFAVVIGDAAVVVHGGQVAKVVTRKVYERGGFKTHDLWSHHRLFGG